MHRYASALCGLFATALCQTVDAAPVVWTFTGTVAERFDAVSDDPIADLLGVPRASVNDIAVALRLVVDPAAAREVLQDDSALQRVNYEDAIVSATVTLNGVNFGTLRRPGVQLGGAIDESELRISNAIAPTGTDNLTLTLGSLIFVPGLTPLFESYTVPFNQTIGGILVPNAAVQTPFLSVNITGPGMFSSTDVPVANDAFSGATSAAVGVTVLADFGLGFGNGSLVLELQNPGFAVSAVPLPSALGLFVPALVLLARRQRRAVAG